MWQPLICQDVLKSDNLLHKWGFIDSQMKTTVMNFEKFPKSLGGHSSSGSLSRSTQQRRESASPAASAYQYRTQQKPSSTVLASELNSPDLILPAAALAQAQAAAAASATSKGTYGLQTNFLY